MRDYVQFSGKGPINPFTDWGFKYIFGREENKDLLKGFLNLLLESEVKIRDIHYLNTELLGYRPELKRCVVDVLATDEEGNRYLIEMQNGSGSSTMPAVWWTRWESTARIGNTARSSASTPSV